MRKRYDDVTISDVREQSDMSAKHMLVVPFVIATVAVVCACICILFYNFVYDKSNGGGNAGTLALDFVNAATRDSDDIWSYLPKQVRQSGNMSADTSWMRSRELKDTKIVTTKALGEQSDLFAQGLNSFYHEDVTVKDAQAVTLTSVFQDTPVTYDVICVKSGLKWYIYTGKPVNIPDVNINPLVGSDVVTKTRHEIKAENVTPYDGAFDYLKQGEFTLDGAKYTMPTSYSSLVGEFIFDDDRIKVPDRNLKPGMILKQLPVLFGKCSAEDYDSNSLSMSIGNPYTDDVDITKGIVTTLFIGVLETDLKYPDIRFPGNVMFGTKYDDVVSVYGELQQAVLPDDICMESYADMDVYKIDLTDDGNSLYLLFDKNDTKLKAICYYCLSVEA